MAFWIYVLHTVNKQGSSSSVIMSCVEYITKVPLRGKIWFIKVFSLTCKMFSLNLNTFQHGTNPKLASILPQLIVQDRHIYLICLLSDHLLSFMTSNSKQYSMESQDFIERSLEFLERKTGYGEGRNHGTTEELNFHIFYILDIHVLFYLRRIYCFFK